MTRTKKELSCSTAQPKPAQEEHDERKMSKRGLEGNSAGSQKSVRTQVSQSASGGSAAKAPAATQASKAAAATEAASANAPAASSHAVTVNSAHEYRWYLQMYTEGVAWSSTSEQDGWTAIDVPHIQVQNDMQSGLNIFFMNSDFFTILPYGPHNTRILDIDMCGANVMAPGQSMEWQYDRMFRLWYGGTKKAFMIVKMPKGSTSLKPTSWEIESKVRDMFKVSWPQEASKPCWLESSIPERSAQLWKCLYEEKMDMYDQVLTDRNDLKTEASLMKGKLFKRNAALNDIRKALECPQCMSLFDSDQHCMVSSCGHLLCSACHAKNVENNFVKCSQCIVANVAWFKFYGMTSISEAVEKIT
jgi:hypothetical protein